MGFNFIGVSETNTNPPNPNPYRYVVFKTEFVGDLAIREIYYPGCTTFNGHKLLLMKDHYLPRQLDPHLLGNGHSVIARFEPNESGWEIARSCANALNKWQNEIIERFCKRCLNSLAD